MSGEDRKRKFFETFPKNSREIAAKTENENVVEFFVGLE